MVKASCLLHIRNRDDVPIDPVQSLILGYESLTLNPGEYGQNPVTLQPVTTTAYLSYESSDEDVATVHEVGVVHAMSPGTCLIRITEEENGQEMAFTVVVEDDSREIAESKAQLSEYVKAASRDLAAGRYTADTVKALKKRIAEANDVLDDMNVIMRDIEIAQVRLLRAWRLLDPVDQEAMEEERLIHEEVNALAKDLIDFYEDVSPAVYTKTSYMKLSAAAREAEKILADGDPSLQQLREARTKLRKARLALVKKSANTLKVKGKTVRLRAKKLKKKAQIIRLSKAVKVSTPCGTVKYRLAGVSKAKFKKYFKVDSKTGKITVEKNLKKGRYSVKIKVSASGDGTHLPTAKTAKVTVKVR